MSEVPERVDGDLFCIDTENLTTPNTYYFIISRGHPDPVLAAFSLSSKQPTLPVLRPTKEEVYNWNEDSEQLQRMASAEFGVSCIILRPVWRRREGNEWTEQLVFVTESEPQTQKVPAGFQWVLKSTFAGVAWKRIHPSVTVPALLTQSFENASEVWPYAQRYPWRYPGWFSSLTNWVNGCLQENRLQIVEPLRILRHSFASKVFCCEVRENVDVEIETSRERRIVFVKTSLPAYQETLFTWKLSEFASQIVPKVLGYNRALNSFLQQSVGSLYDHPFDAGTLMKTITEFQLASTQHVDRFKEIGMQCFNADWLSANVVSILSHPTLKKCPNPDRNVAILRQRIPFIRHCCHEMSRVGIPDTIVHGDLHLGNIGAPFGLSQRRYSIFDWGSAFIGHPFCDFAVVCRESNEELISVSKLSECEAAEVYLNLWKPYTTAGGAALAPLVNIAFMIYWAVKVYQSIEIYEMVEETDRDHVEAMLTDFINRWQDALEEVSC